MNILFAMLSLLSGLYLIIISFSMQTQNFKSSLIFKAIPFILGLGSIFTSLKLFDIITITFK